MQNKTWCTYGRYITSRKSNKQLSVVSRSSAKINNNYELVDSIVSEPGYYPFTPTRLYDVHEASIYVIDNPVFHEVNKEIKVDCHIIGKKIEKNVIETRQVGQQVN